MFQLEGSGMTRYIMEMKPHELAHVIAMIALTVLAPWNSSHSTSTAYIERKAFLSAPAGSYFRRYLRHPDLSGTNYPGCHAAGRL